MNKNNHPITSDQIRQAAESIKTIRPAYADLLTFHEKIFVAQEETLAKTRMEPSKIPEEKLEIKIKEKLPLADISEIRLDAPPAEELFHIICTLSLDATPELAKAAKIVQDALQAGKLQPVPLFFHLLTANDKEVEAEACKIGIEKKFLAFFLYNAIKPSLVLFGRKMADTYLKKEENWQKGYCPICGNSPVMALLGGEGARFLVCSFCWHQWPFKRIACPYCENNDTNTLFYFLSEQEKEYRVDCCDTCKKYIKTVDNRELGRIFYPPLEQMATLHLDMMAKEKGFKPGITLLV